MAQIVKELRVDVSQPNVFQAIVAKQHDSNSRFLKITLVDFGVKVEVPNTAKVTINANRPDGASESFKGEANNDGTITVPLAQWMLDIDGEVKCDVSVTNTEDNKRLTSTDFWLEVQKAANPNASIPLDPDGEILIIKPVNEINENSKDTDYPSAKAVYDYGQSIAADTEITATATGSAIAIDSANAPLQALKLYGKTTQDGTPTPTEPKELKSVGDSGSFEVGVYGKNVLKIRDIDTTNEGITYTVNKEEGYIEVNGTATSFSHVLVSTQTANLPEGEYILSGCPYGYGSSCVLYSNGNTKYDVGNGVNIEVTKDNPILNIVLAVYEGATVNNLRVYPMLRLATETDNTYKPYNKQSLTNNDTLRGIGGIKDERDFAKGVKIQRIEKGKVSSEYKTCIDLPNGSKGLLVSLARKVKRYNVGLMSTHAKFDNSQTCAENTVYENDINIVFCGNATDTYETLVAKFGEAIFYYVLETPIETPLSETELNAYRQLMTNSGNTTILSEADMTLDYYVNKPNAQSIGNIHTQVNKDYLKIQQAIIETGGN